MRDYDVERDSQDLGDDHILSDSQALRGAYDMRDAQIMRDTHGGRDTPDFRRSGGMSDTEVKKRAWVKNVAIIFLAVMLVLTFFSNTIMNRSLPEVAAQYTTSGAITARIRGPGTVIANENFEVKISDSSREVSEVPVRKDDVVNIGDELIKFSSTGPEGLDEAEDKLRELEDELEERQLHQSGTNTKIADASRIVQAARNRLTDAQRQLSAINYSESAYNSALAALNTANNRVNAAQTDATNKQVDLAVAEAKLNALEKQDEDVPGSVPQSEMDAAVAEFNNATIASIRADGELVSAGANLSAAQAALDTQTLNRERWNDANREVRDTQLALDDANAKLTAAQNSVNISNSQDAIELRATRRRVEAQRAIVDRLRENDGGTVITSLVGGIITAIEVTPGDIAVPGEVLMVIEVVDRGYSLSFSVTTAQASRVSVGDQAEVDRGWWWGASDDIRATLVNIRNDPQNTMANRILRFSISGDNVQSGDQLNLILAQRSENYNIIVPNSAIRQDTNGDFVLVVISRSSPLGNRYVATRANVNILARDDTHTAVTGDLTGWDFVITASSKPIDPGMQVRLADNP